MRRIFIILLSSTLLFSLSILGIFANEANISTSERAIYSLGSDISGITSGDPSGIAIESIQETAATYPDSPAVNAAKNFQALKTLQIKDSIKSPDSLNTLFTYLSLVFGSLSILGFTIGSIFLKGDNERDKMYRSYVRKISICLTILFFSSLILYFLIPIAFQ